MYYRRLPFCGKIRLLDVGSCYNPFQAFSEFSAVGIDICPAVNVCVCCFCDITLIIVLDLLCGICSTLHIYGIRQLGVDIPGE